MKVRGWPLLMLLGLAITLAGCSRADPSIIAAGPAGGPADGGNGAGAGPTIVDVAADPAAIAYQQTTLAAAADQPVTVNFNNPAALEHNWVMVEPGQEAAVADAAAAQNGDPTGITGVIAGGKPIANASEAVQLPATPAGEYPYICTVPGHYAAGMKGVITLGAAAAGGAEQESGASAEGGNASTGDANATGGGSSALSVAADPAALAYAQTTMQAPTGQALTVEFNNPSALDHNWVLVEPGQEQAVADAAAAKNGDPTGITGVIAGGKPIASASETINVEAQAAGTYPYICTVPGHYAAGMKGTLTVGP